MRIAIDGRELEGQPTGVGVYLAGLLRTWLAEGEGGADAAHRFVLYHRQPLSVDLPEDPRLETVRLPDASPRGGFFWQQRRLAAALAGDPPDWLFAPADSLPVGFSGRALLTIHDLSYFAHPEWFTRTHGAVRRWLTRRSAARATRIVVPSVFTRDEVTARLGIDGARIEVVPHGLDDRLWRVQPASDARLQELTGLSVPFALTVGSIFERRRPRLLLEAFERLGDVGLGLVIAGDDRRRHLTDLTGEIASRGLADRVRWLRYVRDEDLSALYRAARMVVYLSEYEGFGIPPLEAMSFGVPTIVSRGGALEEVYGGAAVVLEESSPDCVAGALRRVESDPELRSHLARRGDELVGRHTLARSAARTLRQFVDRD